MNLVPKKEPLPLIVGRAVHAGLAAHYLEKPEPTIIRHIREPFQEARKANTWLKPELDNLDLQEEYSIFIVKEYRRFYPTEPWTLLAPECEGHVPLGKHLFFFRCDGVVSMKAKPWILEHKTTGQLGATFFRKFVIDGQTTMYGHAVTHHLKIETVGAVINAIRKSKKLDGVDFARDVVMRDPEFTKSFVIQVRGQVDELALKVQHSSAPLDWPIHPHNCFFYNRACDYLDLCTHDSEALRSLFIPRPPDYVDEAKEAT